MVDPITAPTGASPGAQNTPSDAARLREAARDLEAAFLAEMLKSAGFGEGRESFGGGIGEAQFSSFLRDNYARSMADAGGLGLAEQIFNSLKARSDNG